MSDTRTIQRQLLEGLYMKTMAGEVTWMYDEENGSCLADIGDGYVDIVQESDEETGDYYTVVRVLNGRKQVIDRIAGGGELFGIKPRYTSHRTYASLIVDLRNAAERSAKGADVVTKTILEELGADDLAFPPEKTDDDDVPF